MFFISACDGTVRVCMNRMGSCALFFIVHAYSSLLLACTNILPGATLAHANIGHEHTRRQGISPCEDIEPAEANTNIFLG